MFESFRALESLVALTLLIWLQPRPVEGQMPALVLTDSDAGTTNRANLNQPITVELRGNPSTGYEWSLAATNGQSVVLTAPPSFTPDSGLTGAGGTFSFSLLAQSLGATVLTFDYARSWEPTNPNQTLIFTIEVTSPASPRLSVGLDSGNAIVTWPMAASSGFYVEGCTDLLRGNWAALNAAVFTDGANYKVVLPASGSELYLRLRK